MVLLALLALALAGVAVAALFRLLTLSRTRIATHLDDVGAYGYAAAVPALSPEEPVEDGGPLAAIAGRLGNLVAGRMGAVREDKLRKLLMGAGMYSRRLAPFRGTVCSRRCAPVARSSDGRQRPAARGHGRAVRGLWLAPPNPVPLAAARSDARSRSSAKPRT